MQLDPRFFYDASGPRCSRRSAACRGTGSPRRAPPAGDPRARKSSTCRSRRSWSSGAAAGRSCWRSSKRRRGPSPRVHSRRCVGRGARSRRRVASTSRGFTCRRRTGRPYEDGLQMMRSDVSAAEPVLVLFLGSNIGNFEPPRAARFLSGDRTRRSAGRPAAARRGSRQAGARAAARLRRSARRDGRVQQEPPRSASTASSAAPSTWPAGGTARSGMRASRASRCTWSRPQTSASG